MSWWRRLFGKPMSTHSPQRQASFIVSLTESRPGRKSRRLELLLPPGWSEHPRPNPQDCKAILVRDWSRAPGRLYFDYVGYTLPIPDGVDFSSPEALEKLACKTGRNQGGETLVGTARGKCAFGAWGSAVFRPAAIAHFKIWYLNNGQGDLLQVIHICQVNPDRDEITQAEQIALGLAVHEEAASEISREPSASTESLTLPQAPDGYSWEYAEQAQAHFLRPPGWHFRAIEHDDLLAYFITREPIPPDAKSGSRQFETGISINVWHGVARARGMAPSACALAYVQTVAKCGDYEPIDTWKISGWPFSGHGVQFCSESDIGRLRQQHVLIGNDTTDTLYCVIFETPQRHWERDWPLAFEVFEHLKMHPDV